MEKFSRYLSADISAGISADSIGRLYYRSYSTDWISSNWKHISSAFEKASCLVWFQVWIAREGKLLVFLHMHLTWMNPPAPCSLFILFISIPCLFVDDERERKVINSGPNVTAFFIESWKVEKQESVWFGCHKTCAGGCNCRKWKRGSFKVEMAF